MIVCIGLSHQTAALNVRERLSFNQADVASALAQFARRETPHAEPFRELAILSTCNRVELYACLPEAAPALASEALIDLLAELRGIARADFEASLYRYIDIDAAAHLCRVAAGLESMVLGEPQILGQVIEAYEAAQVSGAAKRVLSALFQAAIRTGKRTHTETAIGRHPSTVSSAAIRLAERIVGPSAQQCALVVGAGEMGALAVKALRARGVQRLFISNRTAQAAIDLARESGGVAVPFAQFPEAMAQADLVFVSTGAAQAIITADMVHRVVAGRAGRPLVLVDVGVPRNVGAGVGELPNVHVIDLDELNVHVQDALSERAAAVPQVEAIVASEVSDFDEWLQSAEALALIADLHKKAEAIRQRELDRTLRYLPGLDAQAQQHIHRLTQSLVDKLLHEPTQRLRAEAGSDHAAQYAATVRYLFGLNSDPLSQTGQEGQV